MGSSSQTRARRPVLCAAIRVRTRAAEQIEQDAAATRHIFDGVDDHRNRLDRRMQRKLLQPAGLYWVHASIFPDIRPITAVLTEFEAVEMWATPFLKAKISSWRER